MAPPNALRIALLAVLAWHSIATAAEPSPPAPLTVDEATVEASNWGLALSPSGRYLASIRRDEKQNDIIVADLQDPSAKPALYAIPRGIVKWVRWDSDERLIAATQFWTDFDGKAIPLDKVEGDRHAVPIKRLVAMDRDGQNFVVLLASKAKEVYTGDLAQVTDFLPGDPRHIIMPVWEGGLLDLFRVDTYSGNAELIAKGKNDTFLWFTDKDGYPAFRVDQQKWEWGARIYVRKGPGNVPADKLKWEYTTYISLRDERESDSAPDFYPLYPGPEENSYYVSARPDDTDTSGIYLYDFAARKYLKTLATEPGVDLTSAFVDSHSYEFLGVSFHRERKVTRMTDPTLQAHFDALQRHFGEADVYMHDVQLGRDAWLVHTFGPRDRGTWHVYRPTQKSLRTVGGRFPDIDANRLGRTQVLRYRARDGLDISGYLTRPPNLAEGSKPPLVIFPHGGPNVRDYWGFDDIVQLLATRGYQVFQPNFRGSSGFGKRFIDAGKRQWGGAMQNDLTDALTFLVDKGYAAPNRACIVGISYGGYAALAGATLTPDLYRCAASIAGISDLSLQLDSIEDQLGSDADSWQYAKEMIGDPDDDEDMLEAHSPVRFASAVKAPVLLIHGDDDRRVPVKHSEKMDSALRKAGKNVRFVKLKDVGHWMSNEDLRKVYPPLLEFLEQHLPVKLPEPAAAVPGPAPPPK